MGQVREGEWEEALEQYASETDMEVEDDAPIMALQGFLRHPLNLNQASKEELSLFFFLNKLQIHAFLKYRKLLGPFKSIYELQTIPHWDLGTVKKLLPYVNIGGVSANHYRLKGLFKAAEAHVLLRYKSILEKQKGYKPIDSLGNTHFLGSPSAIYLRMQYKFTQHLNLGWTAEKDAGEPFSGHGQKGFDFYSFHLYLKDRGLIKGLAVGDYRINMGQGLINQQGFSFGKTGMVMNIDRSRRIIRPHTSAMENGFYRGTAIRIGENKWSSMLFISKKPEDAFLRSEDSVHQYFRSLQKSGYHRSISELKNKKAVNVFSTGGNIQYDFTSGHVGMNVVYHHFSDSMGTSTQPYQRYYPKGYQMLNVSTDYAFYWDRLYFFGETAMNKEGAFSTINGLLMSVEQYIDLSLLYRNYSPQYTALYAKSFGESSHPQNESGFYLGFTTRPSMHWQIDGYCDFFKSKWLRYRVDQPSHGREYLLQVNYQPSKKFRSYIRYRYKKKPLNVLGDFPMAKVVDTWKQSMRFFMEWKHSDYIRIRDEIDGSYYKKGSRNSEEGFMVYQNVRWKSNKQLNGNFRIGYFHTDGYDSRIYTFENNVRYAFYVPSFFGEGLRSYINVRWDIGRHLSLWTRIARTWYFHQQTISSGWNEINGNKKTKLTMELIWN